MGKVPKTVTVMKRVMMTILTRKSRSEGLKTMYKEETTDATTAIRHTSPTQLSILT